jgi:hypothetical protein
MGGTPVRPEDFIERGCFFFYDAHHEDETAEADDILLYFYPEEVPRDSKLFLQGACSAMIAFASKFTNKPVDVVTLKRTKIAFKSLPGKITLVLLLFMMVMMRMLMMTCRRCSRAAPWARRTPRWRISWKRSTAPSASTTAPSPMCSRCGLCRHSPPSQRS